MMLNRTELPTSGIMVCGDEATICGQDVDENPVKITFDKSDRKTVKRILEIISDDKYVANWISTKERVPNDDRIVVVTTINTYEFARRVTTSWYARRYGKFVIEHDDPDTTVVAWMEMPVPYYGTEDDHD